MSFIEKLDPKSLEVFNEAASKPFSQQAVFFLNAFWVEYSDQAEFIYAIIWQIIKMAEMNAKGIQYIHLYQEGVDLDFDIGLYFFEQVCKYADDPNNSSFYLLADWTKANKDFATTYAKSIPAMKTSIVRKKELRDEVDVNFDGRVSLLEFLCYQYKASPKDLIERSMAGGDEDPDVRKARLALEEVNKSIAAYEAEKHRLEAAAKLPGVKGLKAKNELAQLASSPLMEKLNRALITAEAAVRIATKKAKSKGGSGGASSGGASDGALWWMNRDLQEKQTKYGRK